MEYIGFVYPLSPPSAPREALDGAPLATASGPRVAVRAERPNYNKDELIYSFSFPTFEQGRQSSGYDQKLSAPRSQPQGEPDAKMTESGNGEKWVVDDTIH